MKPRCNRYTLRLPEARGFTLVEVMIALAMTSILLLGITTVFVQSRTSFTVNERAARLQEDSRFVLNLLEQDLRMAGYFGLHAQPDRIGNAATPDDLPPPGLDMTGDCGRNWAINYTRPLEASNNSYDWACSVPLEYGTPQPGADSLVVRRVSEDPVAVVQPNLLHLQTARFIESRFFVGIPPAIGPAGETATHRAIVHGYYVATGSSLGPDVPSLRRWSLEQGPQIIDQEIMPGVEDLQLELGIDTHPIGSASRGSIDRYVRADDPIIDPNSLAYNEDAQVISARLWLLLRAPDRENGLPPDARSYDYADRVWGTDLASDGYRRLLTTKTVFLRNMRTVL